MTIDSLYIYFDYGSETDFNETEPEIPLTEADFAEYRLARWLASYVSPLILFVGTCGNVLSFVVLRTRAFKGSSVAFTLSALAVVDTSVLYTSLLRQWLLGLTYWQLEIRDVCWAVGCKLHMFLTYFLLHLSSWTLVVVTVERSCCVCLPLFARTHCTRSRVRLSWIVVAVTLFFLNAHFFWTAEYGVQQPRLTDNHTETICYIGPQYHTFFINVWYWIDFTVLSVCPFILILTGNVLIIVFVVRGARARQSNLQQQQSADSSVGVSAAASVLTSSTAMLIGVSIIFLLTTTPSAIFFLRSNDMFEDTSLQNSAWLRLLFVLTNLLYYTSNAFNFVLYCLAGTRFRRAFLNALNCVKRKDGKLSTTINNQRNPEYRSTNLSSTS